MFEPAVAQGRLHWHSSKLVRLGRKCEFARTLNVRACRRQLSRTSNVRSIYVCFCLGLRCVHSAIPRTPKGSSLPKAAPGYRVKGSMKAITCARIIRAILAQESFSPPTHPTDLTQTWSDLFSLFLFVFLILLFLWHRFFK